MINGITLKVCGMTSVENAIAAAGIGADYLGFIFHPASPRCVTEAKFAEMTAALPATKRVAVLVEPSVEQLGRLIGLGFDAFQIHYKHTLADADLAAWERAVRPSRLWLAPRLPSGEDVKPAWLEHAQTVLLDTFHADKVGGTGQTGDWPKFKRHAQAFPENTWVLAGGLNPDNVATAVGATGTRFVDVNSGVESSPGVKSREKLAALKRALESL